MLMLWNSPSVSRGRQNVVVLVLRLGVVSWFFFGMKGNALTTSMSLMNSGTLEKSTRQMGADGVFCQSTTGAPKW